MAGRKKVYPQVVVIELLVIAAGALAVYFLVPLSGAPHAFAEFLAGMAADRSLILVLRHRNKRLLPRVRLTTQPARRPARRRA